ncbi:HepT-like ribonuclease domain-containing protein [Methanospirillum sp.]|uniref:HepT-like ribonuclease domain-containing protein n=2 Tax=Methanospirillum sp. TaxID=45200 RepID=UPI001BD38F6C|nr:HepT-like ribonuclease domain-containing protein [Methanospirillum sp.]
MNERPCFFGSSSCQSMLRDIRHYLEDAKSIFRRKEKLDQDRRDLYARAMVLFALINRLSDLAREVSHVRGYIRSDEQVKNKVFFKRLHDYGVISWEMRQQMIDSVNFRNRISHHFYEVTRDEIEKAYGMLPVYNEFILIMEQELALSEREKKNMIILAGTALILLVILLLWHFS